MKRLKNHNVFWILMLLALLAHTILNRMFTPWDPMRKWAVLPDALFFFIAILYVAVSLISMRRAYQNKEEPLPAKKKIILYAILLVLCIWVFVSKLFDFIYFTPLQ